MSIPAAIIERIRERASLFEMVSESVQLKRSGRNFVGLCPFHSEKTPSFYVREEEGMFHCFGCGKKGSVFDFVMETRGFSFPETVRFLGSRYGISVPDFEKSSSASLGQTQQNKLLRELMLVVRSIYEQELKGAPLRYLENRKISSETIKHFHLGYAPGQRNFLFERLQKELAKSDKSNLRTQSPEQLKNLLSILGLCRTSDEHNGDDPKEWYDTFKDRVLFPITRSDGLPLGFGGRLIVDKEGRPKYINSPESPLYHKRRALFGLSQALHALRKQRHLFIVEGYLDVLSLSQTQIEDCVATCGTATTAEHAEILGRLVDRATIVFDGDNAGIKAAAQCFETFVNSKIDVQGVVLPEGEDPDSLARKMTGDELRTLFNERRKPIVDVYFQYLLSTVMAGTDSPVLGARVAEQFASVVRKVRNAVEREYLIRRASEHLGVSTTSLFALIKDQENKEREREQIKRSNVAPTQSENFSENSAVPGRLKRRLGNVVGSEHAVNQLHKQLIISLLCEPSLGKHFVQDLDLLDKSESVKYKEQLKEFIVALTENEKVGFCAWERKELTIDEYVVLRNRFQEYLKSFPFDVEQLLDEAEEQANRGGTEHRAVLKEFGVAVMRQNISGVVQKLRLAEADENDASRKQALAQEKLLARRSLERLREGNG